MNATRDLHPIARDALEYYRETNWFRSRVLTRTIANADPKHCVSWTLGLIDSTIDLDIAPEFITQTLKLTQSAIENPQVALLPELDDLSSQSWNSGELGNSLLIQRRAVARLGWASICLICHTNNSGFRSEYCWMDYHRNDDRVLAELIGQCANALEMVYSRIENGRLLILQSFSLQMETLG